MKPRIAFLFSGEIRSNSLNCDVSNNSLVLDTFSQYLFNDELTSKYDYDVFISTNTIDISNAITYFGPQLKNIHLYEKNLYLQPVQTQIPDYEFFRHKCASYKYDGKWVSKGNIWQMYRILDVANLMENYIATSGTTYNLIVRLRLDTPFTAPIIPLFNEMIETPTLQTTVLSDLFLLGRPAIMHNYLHALEHNYMLYKKGHYEFERFIMDCHTYDTCNDFGYAFSPEVQVSECFFQYCIANNMTIGTVLKGYDSSNYLYIYNRQQFA